MRKITTIVFAFSLVILVSPMAIADETKEHKAPQTNSAVLQVEGMS